MKSIRFFLTIWYIGILAVILTAFSFLTYSKLKNNLDDQVNDILTWQAEAVSESLFSFWQWDHKTHPTEAPEKIEAGTIKVLVGRWASQTTDIERQGLQILDSQAAVVASSTTRQALQFPIDISVKEAISSGRTLYQTYSYQGESFRLVTRPVIEDGKILYAVQALSSLKQVDISLQGIRRWLLGLVPIVLLLASFGGWFMAALALKPVGKMIRQARLIKVSSLNERLELPDTQDEIRELAQTFNELFGRLEKSFQRMRQFSAAAAHELRTPISVLQGEIEVTLRKERTPAEYRTVLQTQLEVVKEFSSIVSQLLAVAHADEAEEVIQHSPFVMNQLIDSVIEDWQKSASTKNVHLELRATEQISIRGEQNLLERLVSNLLDNAIKHSPSGGVVTIGLAVENGEAHLCVSDQGPGIAADEFPRIFDKFFSKSQANFSKTGGVGLGLGLCRWIAEAHQGRIEARNSVRGNGAEFHVYLPLLKG